MPHYVKDKWWVSPSNYEPEVLEKFNFPEKITILDTTLRDGEQQADIILSKNEKVEIAKKLDEIGVQRIEAGTPAVSGEDRAAVEEIAGLGLNAKVYCFVRNMVEDMELAKELGVYGVIAEVPGSEHLLKFGKKWTVEQAVEAAVKSTSYAHELGLNVVFFPADSSRADIDFLTSTVKSILDNGGYMDSLTLVDTFGALSPEGAAWRIKRLKETFPDKPIEAHFHDDFGLGVATTIAALAAGAETAHVTVSGIGERAGSASLESLVVSLEALYGVDTGIDLPKLKELSEFTAKYTRKPVHDSCPIVGNEIFGWETGMPSSLWENVKGLDPLIMLPYHWELVGQREPVLSLGKKSGKDNVRVWLERYGLEVDEEKRGDLLLLVKEKSIAEHRVLTEEEFRELVAGLG